MQELADALTSFERQTGRQSALVFIPCSPDEKIVLLASGKINESDEQDIVINWAMYNRKR